MVFPRLWRGNMSKFTLAALLLASSSCLKVDPKGLSLLYLSLSISLFIVTYPVSTVVLFLLLHLLLSFWFCPFSHSFFCFFHSLSCTFPPVGYPFICLGSQWVAFICCLLDACRVWDIDDAGDDGQVALGEVVAVVCFCLCRCFWYLAFSVSLLWCFPRMSISIFWMGFLLHLVGSFSPDLFGFWNSIFFLFWPFW